MAFRDIIGHRRLTDLLARAIARDSLTPSLILSGPDGVGKRLTALSIAQAFNCTAGDQGSGTRDQGSGTRDQGSGIGDRGIGCGSCAACLRIVRGVHPDVQLIEPGENGSIRIDQVREAIDRAVYRPFEGRRRVTIIEHADQLMVAAQNALLKTLEEPLPASVFVLVTSRPDVLLPTVRSRCAHLRFGRLEVGDVAAILETRHRYSRQDAMTAAATSDGSVGRALAVDTGGFAEARSDAEHLLQAAGRDPRTRLDRARDLLKGGGSAASEREHLGARLEALSALVRDIGLLASGADARFLSNLDRRTALDSLARSFGGDRAGRTFTAISRASDALDGNVSPKVVADWLAIQL